MLLINNSSITWLLFSLRTDTSSFTSQRSKGKTVESWIWCQTTERWFKLKTVACAADVGGIACDILDDDVTFMRLSVVTGRHFGKHFAANLFTKTWLKLINFFCGNCFITELVPGSCFICFLVRFNFLSHCAKSSFSSAKTWLNFVAEAFWLLSCAK